jgi:hypothetical protein
MVLLLVAAAWPLLETLCADHKSGRHPRQPVKYQNVPAKEKIPPMPLEKHF